MPTSIEAFALQPASQRIDAGERMRKNKPATLAPEEGECYLLCLPTACWGYNATSRAAQYSVD
jgi:hypothetical protein